MPRLAFVGVCVGLAGLTVAPEAGAEERASGSLSRGAGANGTVASLNNSSTAGEGLSALRMEILAMDSAANVTHVGPAGSNCDTVQKIVFCTFNPPWLPGQPLSVSFDTTPRIPDGAGGSLFVCQAPCGPSQDRGPFTLSGPTPGEARLVLKKASNETRQQESYGVRQGFEYSIEVRNTGTEDAINVRLSDVLPAGLSFAFRITNRLGEPTFAIADPFDNLAAPGGDPTEVRESDLFGRHCELARERRTLNCTLPRIEAGTYVRVFFSVEAFTTGRKRNVADAAADNAAPASSNPVEDTITEIGDSRVDEEESSPDELEGEAEAMNPQGEFRPPGGGGPVAEVMSLGGGPFAAQSIRALSRLARVEVAIRRVGGRRCLWLRSRRGGFRRIKAVRGNCNRGVWLRARGTRRWSLKLRRALPLGNYIAYSRAVNRAGAHERRFSRADGNLVTFKITPARR